jgi:hypothetical protein
MARKQSSGRFDVRVAVDEVEGRRPRVKPKAPAQGSLFSRKVTDFPISTTGTITVSKDPRVGTYTTNSTNLTLSAVVKAHESLMKDEINRQIYAENPLIRYIREDERRKKARE